MKSISLILFIVIFISLKSYGTTCRSLLNPLKTIEMTHLQKSSQIVEEVESDYQSLKQFLSTTDKHLKLMETNEKLREKKGGFARILDAQVVAKVNRLKSALRDNDLQRVNDVANPVMIEFERNVLELNFKQEKLADIRSILSTKDFNSAETSEKTLRSIAKKLKGEIKVLVYDVHKDFKVYTSLRKAFEDQITWGVSEEAKSHAALAFSLIGVSDSSQEAKIPNYFPLIEGERRPTMDMIMAEYSLVNFADGTPRHLSGKSLAIKLELENAALKKLGGKMWFNPKAAHIVIDTLAQFVRKAGDNKFNKFLAKVLDITVKDLQNLSALTSHLAELDKINSVSISQQVSTFEKVRSNYMNTGVVRSHSFDFMTSFARAHEYKRLWKRINLELMLRNVDSTALVDKLISKEKDRDQINAKLDVVRAEINLKSNNISVPETLSIKNSEIIERKTIVEAELAAVRAEIDGKIKEFETNKTDEAYLMARPGMREDVLLLDEMKKAEERSADLGPLSYDYSPGTGARFTRLTIIYIAAARYAVVHTPAMDALDTFLLKNFGFTVPEWSEIWAGSQFVFYKGMEASQSIIETVSPGL